MRIEEMYLIKAEAEAMSGGNGKATFGYQIKCDDIFDEASQQKVGHITGNLQFNDHPAEVKVHGDIARFV